MTLLIKIILNILFPLHLISGEYRNQVLFFKLSQKLQSLLEVVGYDNVVLSWRCQKFDDLSIQMSWFLFINIILKNVLSAC